ncbi:Uma2 family endonuclease [Streptomyces fuscigenes]|uniref:Uma2 family endonuclease n=1 Tax=Streptomyces fuscigenes TaxID=1528880 RepID=UPI001F27BD94|nr:Uma2 family endonuclease [Streptomyces fuscigenes]MCF3964022.1 Uma2 family endonuclease [Streptomyces fuscigenes]
MAAVSHERWIVPEEFEEAAELLAGRLTNVRLELIDGQIRSKSVPGPEHGRIIEWLTRICLQSRPKLWLCPEQGLKVQAYRRGRARPDGVLAESGALLGRGEWADPEGAVLMTLEVTSYDRDTNARDRVEKPGAYAQAGIPVYLLIDRDACEVRVHSEPDGVRYESVRVVPFGKGVELPDPVGITLDTEPLTQWVR